MTAEMKLPDWDKSGPNFSALDFTQNISEIGCQCCVDYCDSR